MARPAGSLIGPRLMLRPATRADVGPVFAAVERSRRELRRWMPWEAWTRRPAHTRSYLLATARARRAGVSYDYVLVERATGGIVGCAGLNEVQRTRVHARAHIGYWVRTDRTGHGFAREATILLLEFAFRRLRLQRVAICVATGNARSRRIPERLGIPFEGIARGSERVLGRFLAHRTYGCTRADWARLRARWLRWLAALPLDSRERSRARARSG